jgi:hypothetical protein
VHEAESVTQVALPGAFVPITSVNGPISRVASAKFLKVLKVQAGKHGAGHCGGLGIVPCLRKLLHQTQAALSSDRWCRSA